MRIKGAGFTLLEILIALFVFTILSLMMAGGLRTVIRAQAGAEESAERVRYLQLVLVRMSRDVEQIVNRPVKTAAGKETPAFLGTPEGFAFTHNGIVSLSDEVKRSSLQRAQYLWKEGALWRLAWPVLDQAQNSPKPSQRVVLNNVDSARFEYLDRNKRFHKNWPVPGRSSEPLPRAVRVIFNIADWGKIQQIYVIPAQVIQNVSQSGT